MHRTVIVAVDLLEHKFLMVYTCNSYCAQELRYEKLLFFEFKGEGEGGGGKVGVGRCGIDGNMHACM